jgi:hypothetical protein
MRSSPVVPEAGPAAGLALLAALSLAGCRDDGSVASEQPSDVVTEQVGSRSASEAERPTPPEPAPASFEPWFEDVTAARGLDFQHVSGHDELFLMPEIMGGGAALVDVDGDGWLDAYLVQSGSWKPAAGADAPGNQLFLNRTDGSFRDVSAGSGAEDRGYGMGVACADLDADGDIDLYVTNCGPNVLLLNDGSGRFTDGTAAAGVGDDGWGTSAAFVDLRGDGAVDLFVANYLGWSADGELSCHNDMGGLDYCDPANYTAPARDVMYRNLGLSTSAEPDGSAAGPRFEDISDISGVGGLPGTGLGVVCGHFDDSGQQSIFVANDGMADRLWSHPGVGAQNDNQSDNQSDNPNDNPNGSRLEDRASLAGCALDFSGKAKAGMGVGVADVDDDGDLDLLVCNLDKQSDSLFLNQGGTFSDRTRAAGLSLTSRRFTRFGVGFMDFDHDGRLDLFQANGRVRRQFRLYSDDPYAEPNLLLRGVGEARFEPLPSADGTAVPAAATSRGAAFGDIENDGGVDVLVVNRDAPCQLLHNLAGPSHADRHWIGFRVLDVSGRDALGAIVRFRVGDRRVRRDVRAAASYLSSNDPRVHAGLGPATEVTEISVRWLDGRVEIFGARTADAWHELRAGTGGD